MLRRGTARPAARRGARAAARRCRRCRRGSELVLDVAVVDVDRDRAELEDRQQRHDVLDAVLGVDPDVVARADAPGGQVVGQPVGLAPPARRRSPRGRRPGSRGAVGDDVDGVLEEVCDVQGHGRKTRTRSRFWLAVASHDRRPSRDRTARLVEQDGHTLVVTMNRPESAQRPVRRDAGDHERGLGPGQRRPRHPGRDPHRRRRRVLRRRRPQGDDQSPPRRQLRVRRRSTRRSSSRCSRASG